MLKRYHDSTASSGFLAGSASDWKWRKTIEFGRGRAFREGRPRSVGKASFYEQALWRRGFFGAPQVGSQGSEFDAFSPSRALLDARARWRSASRRARPSVHGFLRNAVSFLSRAFRILPVANVSPGRVCRVAPRIFSSRENATFRSKPCTSRENGFFRSGAEGRGRGQGSEEGLSHSLG